MVGFKSTADIMGGFALVCGIINFLMVYMPELLCGAKSTAEDNEVKDVDCSVMSLNAWSVTSLPYSIAGPRVFRETLFEAQRESDRY